MDEQVGKRVWADAIRFSANGQFITNDNDGEIRRLMTELNEKAKLAGGNTRVVLEPFNCGFQMGVSMEVFK